MEGAPYGRVEPDTSSLPSRASSFQPTTRALEAQVHAVHEPALAHPTAPLRRPWARIVRYLAERFVSTVEPAAAADNNAAEHRLRPLLISCEISGGTRSRHASD